MSKPHNYIRLIKQGLEFRFGFIDRCKPHNTEHPEREGFVQLVIRIGEREYGPYQTAYRTTRAVWDGRKSVRQATTGFVTAERTAF